MPQPQARPQVRASAARTRRLALDQIVDAAVTVTRQHGLAYLTMRTLAEELGVTPMAIYHHVPSKNALVDLVIDAVIGRIEVPDPLSGSWSERLWQLNRASRKALAAHRGLAEALLARPPTPAVRRQTEATIAILEEAGFDHEDARRAYDTFTACMFGRMPLARAQGEVAPDDAAYRWSFDTLIAGFERRIAARRR